MPTRSSDTPESEIIEDETGIIESNLACKIEDDVSVLAHSMAIALSKHRAKQKQNEEITVKVILQWLEIPGDSALGQQFLGLIDRETDLTFHGLAHRNALGEPRRMNGDFEQFVKIAENLFELILGKIAENFGEYLAVVERLLEKPVPGKKDVTQLLNHLPNSPVILNQFFQHADSTWLEPLIKKNVFNNPPIIDVRMGNPTHWNAAGYLKRIALDLPAQVVDVMLNVPDVGNRYIYEEFSSIAAAIPIEQSLRLKPLILIWLQQPFALIPEHIAEMAWRFCEAGYTDDALEVTKQLLMTWPEGQRTTEKGSEVQIWHYVDLAQKYLIPMATVMGMEYVEIFSSRFLFLFGKQPGFYFRFHWSNKVEQNGQYQFYDGPDALFSVFWGVCSQAIKSSAKRLKEIVNWLNEQNLELFRRLLIVLLIEYGFNTPELVRHYMLDRRYFQGGTVEYRQLLKTGFSMCSDVEKTQILQWIDEEEDNADV